MEFNEHNVEYGYSYESAAIVPDGTPAPISPDEIRIYEPSTRPGAPLPHAWIDDEDGNRRPIKDLVRPGRFLLIAGEDGRAWCEAAAQLAGEANVPIDALRIGHLDGDLYDPRCMWLRHRQISSDGAILVRPDRFIAWRHATAAENPRAALAGALSAGAGSAGRRSRPLGGVMSAPRCDGALRRDEVDVAIVGYGPVGQALAALLGRAGHRVAVFERYQEIYRLPRAVHLDHEIMRLLQTLGLADTLATEMVAVHDYQWFGADGELLLRFDVHEPGALGLGVGLHVLSARAGGGARSSRLRPAASDGAARLGRRGAGPARRRRGTDGAAGRRAGRGGACPER